MVSSEGMRHRAPFRQAMELVPASVDDPTCELVNVFRTTRAKPHRAFTLELVALQVSFPTLSQMATPLGGFLPIRLSWLFCFSTCRRRLGTVAISACDAL
jgi:hypothetical protein